MSTHLVISIAEAYPWTVSGEGSTRQKASLLCCCDAPDHCGAPIIKQVVLRRPERGGQSHWSICISTTDGGRKWEGYVVDFLTNPAIQPKPRRQEGAAVMSGSHEVWWACAVNATGPYRTVQVSSRQGRYPLKGALPPRARNGRKGHMMKDVMDISGRCKWNGTRGGVFYRLDKRG
jgi:hypothetical protein